MARANEPELFSGQSKCATCWLARLEIVMLFIEYVVRADFWVPIDDIRIVSGGLTAVPVLIAETCLV